MHHFIVTDKPACDGRQAIACINLNLSDRTDTPLSLTSQQLMHRLTPRRVSMPALRQVKEITCTFRTLLPRITTEVALESSRKRAEREEVDQALLGMQMVSSLMS